MCHECALLNELGASAPPQARPKRGRPAQAERPLFQVVLDAVAAAGGFAVAGAAGAVVAAQAGAILVALEGVGIELG